MKTLKELLDLRFGDIGAIPETFAGNEAIRRLAGRGEEGECVTLLLEGGGHREDALDEAAAPLAVGAEADLAPDDGVA